MVAQQKNKPQTKRINPLDFGRLRITIESLTDKKMKKQVFEANSIIFFAGRVINPLKETPDIEADSGVVGEELVTTLLLQMIPSFMQQYFQKRREQISRTAVRKKLN